MTEYRQGKHRYGEHRHGGDPRGEFERFGLDPVPVIDFSANLSPLGPPERIRRLWPELWRRVERYPSLRGAGVVSYFESRFGLDADRVLAGNGATELLYLIPRALGLRRAAVLQPSYADYERACRLAGVEVEPLVLEAASGFAAPDHRRLSEAPGRVDAVFLCHPNNPTGTLFDPALLRRLAAEHPEVWWVVDESFIQLTDVFPAGSLAFGGPTPPNLLVIYSLTKTYALAGLRLGAVIADPGTIARLARFKEPWTVNGVADRVARELADCEDYEDAVGRLLSRERRRLFDALDQLDATEVWPPAANFLLARWRWGDLDTVLRGLLQMGFCVRDCRNFPGLENGYFRLAVRGPEDNRGLIEALRRLAEEAPSKEPPC